MVDEILRTRLMVKKSMKAHKGDKVTTNTILTVLFVFVLVWFFLVFFLIKDCIVMDIFPFLWF